MNDTIICFLVLQAGFVTAFVGIIGASIAYRAQNEFNSLLNPRSLTMWPSLIMSKKSWPGRTRP